jgi:hypothetical protein
MFSILDILAEQRIADAQQRGEFDNLPGAGKPLVIEDEPFASPEERMVNKILKNAGCAPEGVMLRKEIATLRQTMESLPEGEQRQALRRELVVRMIALQLRH